MLPTFPSIPGFRHLSSGKVRELFEVGPHSILMIATDRISAFDAVLDTEIPDKGKILTALSLWWFNRLADVVPHHVITADFDEFPQYLSPYRQALAGRSILCERLDMIQVECVARAYLAGSALAEYRQTGTVAGISLPAGLSVGSRLPEVIFTPAIKASTGQHDENISFREMVGILGRSLSDQLKEITLSIYHRAASIAIAQDIILADTKLEFGRGSDGTLRLGDEVLTPDSSRFWPAHGWHPGTTPESLDKQPIRDWLAGRALQGRSVPLPPDIVAETRDRYRAAYEQLTGRTFTNSQTG